jgi:predicted dehydrogenase
MRKTEAVMNDRTSLGIAIIGAGVMGEVYARAVVGGNLRFRAHLVGVCDIDPEAARRLAAETQTRAFTDVGEMLETAGPDMAYVAVPDHLHRQPFLDCVERGVACLVEKPLATTIEDALAMRDAAAKAHVLAEVNFSNRWNPVFRRVREAIAAGDVGDVVGVNARLSNVLDYPVRHLRWASHTTGGWFLLSHVFDLTQWLTGARATQVTASGVRRKLASVGVDTYDIIQSLVRYDAGWSGIYETAWVLPNSLPSMVDFKFEVVGTDGAIYVDQQDQMVHVAGTSAVKYPDVLDWDEARLSSFLDLLANGGRPTDLLDAGVDNTVLLVALHRAIAEERPVDVSAPPTGTEIAAAIPLPSRVVRGDSGA